MKSRSFELGCTVRVSHRFDDLSAHVELDGDIQIYPGDEVRVHGPLLAPASGEVRVERRFATVTRASRFKRLWARLTGDFDALSLLEVGLAQERNP